MVTKVKKLIGSSYVILIRLGGVSTFGGMVEWNGGMEYWNGLLEWWNAS